MSFIDNLQRQASRPPRTAKLGFGGMTVMILMSLGFIAAGGFALFFAVSSFFEWRAMQSWRETPAQILHAKLTSHRGGKGGTTYGIDVLYEYTFAGKIWQATRADLFNKMTEGGGEYQRQAVNNYQQAMARRRTVPCYVNPANPASAVLDRRMRWGTFYLFLVLGMVFASVGAGILTYSQRLRRQGRIETVLQTQLPGQPWLWEKEWAGGRIRSSSRSGAVMLTLFALFWNAIGVLPILINWRSIVDQKNPLTLLILLFPMVGAGLIIAALRAWYTWSILGDAVFTMTDFPAVVGDILAGTIGSKCPRLPTGEVRLTLSCQKSESRGEDTQRRTLWENSHIVRPDAIAMTPEGIVIPVLFQIPAECESAGRATRISWQLTLQGQFGGTASRASFNVPVFKVEGALPSLLPDEAQMEARYYTAPTAEVVLKQAAVAIEPLPGGGRRYVFHANRTAGMILFQIVFALAFTGVAAALWVFKVVMIFPIVFSLFDLLILYAFCDTLLWSGFAEVSRQGVLYSNGIFAKSRPVLVSADEIRRLTLNIGMTQGTRSFFDLQLETAAGRRITLAKRLRERDHGQWLIGQMEADLGKKAEGVTV